MKSAQIQHRAFTLVELLTVIAIIAVLMGLLFPTVGAVRDAARRAQAQNDLTQIVTAVRAFYTEYGRYPNAASGDSDTTITGSDNAALFDTLRAVRTSAEAQKQNPRLTVFFEGTEAKEDGRYGFQTSGQFRDPWGEQGYFVRMDTNYDNEVGNPYSSNAGPADLRTPVIAWSLGKDGDGGSGGKNTGVNRDDVISWQ